jgi:hypothetical protein
MTAIMFSKRGRSSSCSGRFLPHFIAAGCVSLLSASDWDVTSADEFDEPVLFESSPRSLQFVPPEVRRIAFFSDGEIAAIGHGRCCCCFGVLFVAQSTVRAIDSHLGRPPGCHRLCQMLTFVIHAGNLKAKYWGLPVLRVELSSRLGSRS